MILNELKIFLWFSCVGGDAQIELRYFLRIAVRISHDFCVISRRRGHERVPTHNIYKMGALGKRLGL